MPNNVDDGGDGGRKEYDLNEYGPLDDPTARRQVRAEYRHLLTNVEENAEDIVRPESTELHRYLEQAEELFTKVRHPREAVCDSAFLLSIARKGAEQVQQLKTDLVSFDNLVFAEKVLTFMCNRNFEVPNHEDEPVVNVKACHWEKLNEYTRKSLNRPPSFDCLLGPLVIQIQENRSSQKRKSKRDDQHENSQKVQLKNLEKVDNQEEATTKEVERILKALMKETKQGKTPLCFFSFVIDPTSFGQTVENIFHTSFLVKDGKASIKLDEDKLPIINISAPYLEDGSGSSVERFQVVMSMNISEWQRIIESFQINSPMIPTR